jgi:hypothetical protein
MSRPSFLFASLVITPALLMAQAGLSPSGVTPASPPPPEPYVIEDGGFSLEPVYWLNRAQPVLRGGAVASADGSLDFGGQSKYGYGGIISVPAGPQNSLRFSYFRVQGNGNTVLGQDVSLFSENYSNGDYLNSSYRLQNFKLSWDYLGYTWRRGESKIRLKTLYEVQYVTISASSYAPFKAVTTDSTSGTTDYNTAHGSSNLIYPTLGLEVEQAFGKRFRWEAKASGFGIPKRAAIGDMEGSLAARFGEFELSVGEKAYYFKTSPRAAEYFSDMLSGAFVGLRYYWGRE